MAAINLSNLYTQNFDSLVNSGTGNTWTDDATILGWYSNRIAYNAGTGSSNTGALYSFGSTSATDRALGGVASGTTATIFWGVRLINDTSSTISSLDINYIGEQWRNGGSSSTTPGVAQKLDFQYQIGATSLIGGTWTDFDALDFTSPIFGTTASSALDGNAAANRTNLSATLSNLTLAPGQEIWLRWQDSNDANNDHGLAIDDLSISAVAPPAGVSITQSEGSTAVNEAGETTDTYTIALNTVPTGDVTVQIAADGETQISSDGVNFFDSLTLTLNTTTPQTITVRAINDTDVEGSPHTGTISHTITNTADPAYSTITIPNITVNITDNDIALTPIYTIQGSGATSSLVGNTVTTEGVVVGDFQGSNGLNGFYIQDAIGDGNFNTSDGIFVFAPGSFDVSVGQVVRLTGVVAEFFSQTQIQNLTSLSVVGTNAIAPTAVDLPVTATTDLERYEGMLVTFPEALTVTENFNLGRFGELVLSADGRLFNPTNSIDPTDILSSDTNNDDNNVAAVTAAQTANNLRRIILDDGSNIQNPTTIPYLNADNTRRVGDTVTDLTGALGFGFGNYRIQPTTAPTFSDTNPRTTAPDLVGGNVKVASFNVLNYFTTFNSRGANNQTEFDRQRAKIFAALAAMDADVVGLIEVENNGDGAGSAIANLVEGLNNFLGAPVYDYIRDPATGVGADQIKTAFIYKPAKVTPFDPATSSTDPIFDRLPVAQTFSLNTNGEKFTAVINHFKSKGSAPSDPNDPNADLGDGQGAWNLKRTQQAEALLAFVDSLKTASGDSDVLVIGDLNAYGEEDPIDVLRAGGLVDELGRFTSNPYSFVFDGQSGRLDHALTTASLSTQVTGVTEWHINADEPRVLDYNLEFKGAGLSPDLYAPTPYRSSDHDPVIVGLHLNATPQANDDAATVTEGQSVVINVLTNDTDADGDLLTLANFTNPTHGTLVQNNDGTFSYTANLNFSGNDSFTYTVSDGQGGTSNTANVTLTINPLNLEGTASADTLVGTDSNNTIDGKAGNDTIIAKKGNDTLTGGGDRDTFVIRTGDGTDTIADFGGVGTGVNPSATEIAEADTLKFEGSGLIARHMLLTQNGSNLEITFEGVDNTRVILQNFALENLDNLQKSTGAKVDLGNILFDGQNSITDSFDVFDSNHQLSKIFNSNSVTFLNDLNNFTNGLNNSDDVINGQGGNDKIDGGSGNDLLRGGIGNDTLIGGMGNDLLVGNEGNDTLRGGSGGDRFILAEGAGSDTISDFTNDQDLIGLVGVSFAELTIAPGTVANTTLISVTSTNELLAILTGVNASTINAVDFVAS